MSVENDHPFRCNGCGSDYRRHRYAAKCCKIGSTDLRSGAVRAFSATFEQAAQESDERQWQRIYDEHPYDCSCGESFRYVEDAVSCRKCRTYTSEGYCTAVMDRRTGETVWTAE